MTDAEIKLSNEKLRAAITKQIDETGRVQIKSLLVPFLAAAGLIGITIGVLKAVGAI